MMIDTLAQASYDALINLWSGFILFLPVLIGGIILFLLGLVIGNVFGQLVEKVFKLIKIDAALEKTGFKTLTDRAGVKLNTGFFFGQIVRWLIILSFLIAVCNFWNLGAVGNFIQSVVNYIPNLIVAILIILLSIILGEFFSKFIRVSVAGAGLRYKNFLGTLSRLVVLIFGFLAALAQLQIAQYLLNVFNILIIGLVLFFAIAGGLAFGLGGKDLAQDMLKKFKEGIEEK